MRVYLASPRNQMQSHAVMGMPVLVSYACYSPWMDDYLPSYDRILVDSGAYSEMNSGQAVDVVAYTEWVKSFNGIDAWAGLDDISGDWRRSLKNYEYGGFPTFHNTDPDELLDDLLPIARESGNWLGIGLMPPREGKERWLRETLDRIPEGIHVHGWALRAYTHLTRIDSVDSTNWMRDYFKYRNDLPWLTPAECIDIVVKRYKRWTRMKETPSAQMTLTDQS